MQSKLQFIFKRTLLLFFLASIITFLSSQPVFAATSIKYGWIALDENNTPVLQGTRHILTNNKKPIHGISNGNGNIQKIAPEDVVYLQDPKTGSAQALIIGSRINNNYKDAFITRFMISPESNTSEAKKLISELTIANISDQTYTGKPVTPAVVIKNSVGILNKDVDYTISYNNNVNVGTATITITGKNSYTGTVIKKFAIKQAPISKVSMNHISTKYYTGSKIEPKPSVKCNGKTLKKEVDYKLTYKHNKNTGTAKIILTGKGNYSGKVTKTFKITSASIKSASISKIKARYTDSLTEIKPKPVIKLGKNILKEGRDYTLTYKNNKKPGIASIIVKGTGKNIKGSRTINFKLVNIGDDLAKTACRLSYTQPTWYQKASGTHKYWHKVKNPGTSAYMAAYKKYRDAYKKPEKNAQHPQYCSTSIGVIVSASKYVGNFPTGFFHQNTYLMKGIKDLDQNEEYKALGSKIDEGKYTTYRGWTCVASGDLNSDFIKKLQPGDIVKNLTGHVCMYVGDIPQRIYNKELKNTDGDKGAPRNPENNVEYHWVSAHGGYYSNNKKSGYACSPSIGDKKYATLGLNKQVKAFRCTKPSDGKHVVGGIV